MNCRQAENLIQTALDGRLGRGDRSRLDAHLAACEACRGAWDDYRALSRKADTWTQRAINADDLGSAFTDRVMAQIATTDLSRRSRAAWHTVVPRALAALALMVASVLTGPFIPAVLPTTSFGALLPLNNLASSSGWRQMMGGVPQDVLGAWGSLTHETFHLSGWVWDILALTLGINLLFIWWMRRPSWETAGR